MSLKTNIILVLTLSIHSGVQCGIINNEFKLDIIHYNDFHDRFEQTTEKFPICKNSSHCIGGFARLYNGIKLLLKEKPNALLLNAGDIYQGTYWYTLNKWTIPLKFINLLPNDAHALGNHEFDDGIEGLIPYLAGLQGPVVAANIDSREEPRLQNLYKPHVIVQRGGKRIGIIGLIAQDTDSGGRVSFLDPFKTAQDEAQFLTERGVDIIILLSHCGLSVDLKIAKTVGQNIDVIVGGHSHSLLWNGTSPTNEAVSGPYPMLIDNDLKPGHKVVVVTASAFTKYLGNITIYFDNKGELITFDGQPVFLNQSIEEDPEIKALLKPYADEIHKIVDVKIGLVTEDMLHEDCSTMECSIGDLTADAFWYAANKTNHTLLPHVVFFLGNNIRGSLSKGEINRGDVIVTLPYKFKVMTFTLQGRHLVEALEYCTTKYWKKRKFQGPWLPQVSGMKVTLNTTAGQVISVRVKTENNQYQSLDPESEYQVTSVEPVALGRHGFKMISENLRNSKVVGIDDDILEEYIRLFSPIVPYLDNRLIILE